jgi:hypothetical protein
LRKAIQLRQRALQQAGAQAVGRLIADTRNGKLASVTCCQRRSINAQMTWLIHHEEITNDDDQLQTEEFHATPRPPELQKPEFPVACESSQQRKNDLTLLGQLLLLQPDTAGA